MTNSILIHALWPCSNICRSVVSGFICAFSPNSMVSGIFFFFLVNCGVILCSKNQVKLTGSISFLYLFGLNCDFEFILKYWQIEDYLDQACVTFDHPPWVNLPFSDPFRSTKITHEVFRMLCQDLIHHFIGTELTKIAKEKSCPMFSECEFKKCCAAFLCIFILNII